jgi:hypothetical protein
MGEAKSARGMTDGARGWLEARARSLCRRGWGWMGVDSRKAGEEYLDVGHLAQLWKPQKSRRVKGALNRVERELIRA